MASGELSLRREDLVGPEQSVIGSMLIDPKVVGLVVDELTEADFTMEINRSIFRSFRRLYLEDRTLDRVTLLDLLGPHDAAVNRYVLELMDLTPTAANIKAYIALTRKNTLKVRFRELGAQLMELEDPETEGLALMRQGENLLAEQGKDEEADMARCMVEFTDSLDTAPQGIPWGFGFLDQELAIGAGSFVVLGGRPSDGKTALALHMAYKQSETKRVGFFSLETDRNTLFTRLVASVTGIPGAKLRRRNLSEMEYGLIEGSADRIISHNMRIVESAGWTVEQIEARVMARKFEVVYVDYLQLIQSSGKRDSRQDEVADISRALANMARKHGITVVALSQLSRPSEGKRREPVMSDLRESGQIEQDADAVMFVWRLDETSSDAERTLTLAKNKEGRLGTWPLVFRGEIQRFVPELSGFERPKQAPKRREPEYKQQAFYDLPGSVRVPFEEDGYGAQQKTDPGHPGDGGHAAPGPGQAVRPCGPPPAGGGGPGACPPSGENLPF